MTRLVWMSFDNKTFDTKEECEAYEKQALEDKVEDFKKELHLLFDSNKIYGKITIEDGSDLLEFIEDTLDLDLLKEYIELREALGKRLINV
ncbi:MAG: hypothetical protein ACMV1B_12150 [Prevotella sp.]